MGNPKEKNVALAIGLNLLLHRGSPAATNFRRLLFNPPDGWTARQ